MAVVGEPAVTKLIPLLVPEMVHNPVSPGFNGAAVRLVAELPGQRD
jgi:hypothetical protein